MVNSSPITPRDQAVILSAVQLAEQRTSGEIVTVIARASDEYVEWAMGLSLACACGAAVAVQLLHPLAVFDFLTLQAIVFMVCMVGLQTTGLMARLVPQSTRRSAVKHAAQTQFFKTGLHTTKTRAGILIYLSWQEHCIEIIADHGIDAVVAPGTWEKIADTLGRDLRTLSAGDAVAGAVTTCAGILAAHFPAEATGPAEPGGNPNELPDPVILI